MTAVVAEKPEAKAKAAAPKKEYFDLASIAPISAPRPATKKFSAFIVADKGIGKTSLLGTIADVEELSPMLILATEDGTSVLAGKYDDVDVITTEDWDTSAKIITAYANGETKYKTMAVDTFPELQEQMRQKTTKNGTTPMEFSDWAFIADESIKVAKMLHRCPGNVVFTAHAEKVKDESTGKVMTTPYFLGKKSLVEVLKPIDLVLYLGVAKGDEGKTIRVLQTQPDGKIMASDRTGKLEEFIPDPTFQTIWDQLTA